MPTPVFDINPPSQPGQGAFGTVPGAIGLPDPFGDLNKAVGGGLGATNQMALGDIQAELGGVISPSTYNALNLAAAQRGVGGGMGFSGLTTNDLFGNIANFSENQQQRGIQNYNQLIPTISKTQTVDPTLQTEVASRNATFGAAPNPAAAASYARQLFEEYLNKLRGGAGSTPRGGYTIVGSPAGGTAPVAPRAPGVGGGGGGVGLPAGGVSLPGSQDFFDWFTGGGIYDPSTGTQVGGGSPTDFGSYAPGESPTAPVTYAGGVPPPAGGIDWTDPFGVGGGAGGPDSITAPPTADLANDFWDSF